MSDLHDEVTELTQAIIRIDSTNGNETPVAQLLADYLSDAGVKCELVARQVRSRQSRRADTRFGSRLQNHWRSSVI